MRSFALFGSVLGWAELQKAGCDSPGCLPRGERVRVGNYRVGANVTKCRQVVG
jgi:hypothetical protein